MSPASFFPTLSSFQWPPPIENDRVLLQLQFCLRMQTEPEVRACIRMLLLPPLLLLWIYCLLLVHRVRSKGRESYEKVWDMLCWWWFPLNSVGFKSDKVSWHCLKCFCVLEKSSDAIGLSWQSRRVCNALTFWIEFMVNWLLARLRIQGNYDAGELSPWEVLRWADNWILKTSK